MQSGDTFSGDVYGMFFSKAAFDRFKLSKEEFALLKEQEVQAEKEKKEAEDKAKAEKKDTPTAPAAKDAPKKRSAATSGSGPSSWTPDSTAEAASMSSCRTS